MRRRASHRNPAVDLFPDPREADEYGLVALGGDYRPEILLAAYTKGIFPWPSEELPYAWFSPDPRMVLVPGDLRVSRRLERTLRQGRFRVTFDTAFDQVIDECAAIPRRGQPGTWITEELRAGFRELHRLGVAHSCETWLDDRLVGGIYGLSLGTMFCGESMFHRRSDASKVALTALCRRIEGWGFRLLDCQVHTDHMERLGADEWSRDDFLDELAVALEEPTRLGSWSRDDPEAVQLLRRRTAKP